MNSLKMAAREPDSFSSSSILSDYLLFISGQNRKVSEVFKNLRKFKSFVYVFLKQSSIELRVASPVCYLVYKIKKL